MAGIVGGYVALSSGLFYKSRATGTYNPPVACPVGTEQLFTKTGTISPGHTTAVAGVVTTIDGSWIGESREGVLLVANGNKLTVSFPIDVVIDTVLIFDNDPKTGEKPWSINGNSLPTTPDDTWAQAYKLNITAKQMNFDYGGDSPHFNVCIKANVPTPTRTNTPTPTPTPTLTSTPTPKPSTTPPPTATNACPKPNPVKNLRINCPLCKQS